MCYNFLYVPVVFLYVGKRVCELQYVICKRDIIESKVKMARHTTLQCMFRPIDKEEMQACVEHGWYHFVGFSHMPLEFM